MSDKFINDLTFQLTQGLDKNYDIVNMETVVSVISALESVNVTKEQLEITRLAKFINFLRRRTKSEYLARRAKRLLKKWRQMVGIQQTVYMIGKDTSSHIGGTSGFRHQHIPEIIELFHSPASTLPRQSISGVTNHKNLALARCGIISSPTIPLMNPIIRRSHSGGDLSRFDVQSSTPSITENSVEFRNNAIQPAVVINDSSSFLNNLGTLEIQKVQPMMIKQKFNKSHLNILLRDQDKNLPIINEMFGSNNSLSSNNSWCVLPKLTCINNDDPVDTENLFPSSNLSFCDEYNEIAPVLTSTNSNKSFPNCDGTYNNQGNNQLVTTFLTELPSQKIPKKRGRKKGSKGIDSFLARSSQLQLPVSLFTPGSKRVKTTKELLADFQNRKFSPPMSSPLSNVLSQSRPDTPLFSGEPLVASPGRLERFATCDSVSEKSIPANKLAAVCGAEIGGNVEFCFTLDNTSTEEQLQYAMPPQLNSCPPDYDMKSVETIEDSILNIISQLPPVNIDSLDWKMYDSVPCTCKIIETKSQEAKYTNENSCEDSMTTSSLPVASKTSTPLSTKLSVSMPILLESIPKPSSEITPPSTPLKRKFSVFDLCFDSKDPEENSTLKLSESPINDSNPIHLNISEGLVKIYLNECSSDSVMTTTANPQSVQTKATATTANSLFQLEEDIPQGTSNFVVHEDPFCPAKYRYYNQTNLKSDSFQNLLIPNANGNWINPGNSTLSDLDILPYCDMISGSVALQQHNTDQIMSNGLWANVVPKYASLMDEDLNKLD